MVQTHERIPMEDKSTHSQVCISSVIVRRSRLAFATAEVAAAAEATAQVTTGDDTTEDEQRLEESTSETDCTESQTYDSNFETVGAPLA